MPSISPHTYIMRVCAIPPRIRVLRGGLQCATQRVAFYSGPLFWSAITLSTVNRRDVAPDAVGPKKDARDCTSLKCFKNSGPSKHFRTPTKDGFSVESTKAMWTALGRARMLALKDARVACRIHLAPFTYSPFDQKQLTWSVQNGTLA